MKIMKPEPVRIVRKDRAVQLTVDEGKERMNLEASILTLIEGLQRAPELKHALRRGVGGMEE
jgi:hypothetical protein